MNSNEAYDVVIVGGGPGGLAAALALGRARKRVLLCDSGTRRNHAAVHINNFVTRDGTIPDEFRNIARGQLTKYPQVNILDAPVEAVKGGLAAFRVELSSSSVTARRVLLCTGMVDEMLPVEGFDQLWGSAIFQCPYCHGWEVRDRRWAYLVDAADEAMVRHFALQALAWTNELVLLTTGKQELSQGLCDELGAAGIGVEMAPVARLHRLGKALESVELADGTRLACDFIFAHPPQHHVPLVAKLGLDLDEAGFVRVDPMTGETSQPGIYAAGDLTTRMQGAILAAAAATRTSAMINAALMVERVTRGTLAGHPQEDA